MWQRYLSTVWRHSLSIRARTMEHWTPHETRTMHRTEDPTVSRHPDILPGILVAAVLTCAVPTASAEQRAFTFAVISQRSPTLTAQYWNPILGHAGARAGVTLDLKLHRSGPEHAATIGRGEADFIYSNHNFAPGNDGAGYRVIARDAQSAIAGQIVVPQDSRIVRLAELQGHKVVFPSKSAFVGYHVPMDALLANDIRVEAVFAGNQEGAMGQLRAGAAPAAGVNSEVMKVYAERESFAYRVLWTSEPFQSIPVSTHPRVPAAVVQRVRDALVGMTNDPDGRAILAASASLIRQPPPHGFVAATDADYENVRRFHRSSRVKEGS